MFYEKKKMKIFYNPFMTKIFKKIFFSKTPKYSIKPSKK